MENLFEDLKTSLEEAIEITKCKKKSRITHIQTEPIKDNKNKGDNDVPFIKVIN